MTLAREDIERIAELLADRVAEKIYLRVRGEVLDAVQDGVARAAPAALASNAVQTATSSETKNSRRSAWLAGWEERGRFTPMGPDGWRLLPAARDVQLAEYLAHFAENAAPAEPTQTATQRPGPDRGHEPDSA